MVVLHVPAYLWKRSKYYYNEVCYCEWYYYDGNRDRIKSSKKTEGGNHQRGIYLSIYVSIYVCHASGVEPIIDSTLNDVTMDNCLDWNGNLGHCDVIEQPAKTDTLTISDRKGLN